MTNDSIYLHRLRRSVVGMVDSYGAAIMSPRDRNTLLAEPVLYPGRLRRYWIFAESPMNTICGTTCPVVWLTV